MAITGHVEAAGTPLTGATAQPVSPDAGRPAAASWRPSLAAGSRSGKTGSVSMQTDSAVVHDVVIIGGGPAGLLLAGDLAAAGIRPLVLERAQQISQVPKANGIVGHAAVELRRRGLLRGTGLRVLRTPRFRFGPLEVNLGLVRSPLHILAVPQRQLTDLLEQRARRLGASISRGQEFTALEQDRAHVLVRVRTPDARLELRARYLVGCDGAHSPVRKQAGIAFGGTTSSSISRQARITIPDAVARRDRDQLVIAGTGPVPMFRAHLTGSGSVTLAPADALDRSAPHEEYLVSTREPRSGAEPADDLPESELRASLRRVLGAELGFTASSARRSVVGNSRQAERYREGRVFLAGDAAHVFGAGGSALNAGLADAISLGTVLATVLRGGADERILDTYQAQRHPAGQRVLAHTRLQTALEETSETGSCLREVFGELLKDRATARRIAALLEA